MAAEPGLAETVRRGLRRLCPRCGQGKIYKSFWNVNERCPACDLLLDPSGESFGIYYVLTASITGALIFCMILLRPPSLAAGFRMLVPGALVAYVCTGPFRKGLALALNYRFNPKEPRAH